MSIVRGVPVIVRLRGCRLVHLADEAIADAGQRLDITGCFPVVTQRVAQPRDRIVQAVVEVDVDAGRPDLAAQLLACHDLAGTLEQQAENLERLFL